MNNKSLTTMLLYIHLLVNLQQTKFFQKRDFFFFKATIRYLFKCLLYLEICLLVYFFSPHLIFQVFDLQKESGYVETNNLQTQ